jgi:ethanolamine utilization protein EutA
MTNTRRKYDELVSAGIDIGTTSTHLTISRLGLANRSVPNQAVRLQISSREVIYQSPIHMTPLTEDGVIDAEAVAELVASDYSAAGLNAEDIETGAVIITGETARLRNAEAVTHALAVQSGRFVVASAGPNLESILAARGSGAADYSQETGATICNIDVGGGTANIAVFAAGELLDTACLSVGARFLRLSADGCLVGVSDSGELFLDATAKKLPVGSPVSEEVLELIGHQLGEVIVQYILHAPPPQISERLLVSDSLHRKYKIDQFWLSGGVAELIKMPPDKPLIFGDIGHYLAQGLNASFVERNLKVHIPDQPIRATVSGASMHSLQLSGSTIAADCSALPLRNLPIVRPFSSTAPKPEDFCGQLSIALARQDLDWQEAPVAIALETITSPSYQSLTEWTNAIVTAFRSLRGHSPLVLILKEDIAMALGQLLRGELPGEPAVVLDGISCAYGDYLDVGQPFSAGRTLPVVVKNLIF